MNVTGPGLALCFGRHSGYGGYGSWTRGSRQVVLDERVLRGSGGSVKKREVETWVRLEDRTVSGRVVLNATYGEDRYQAVNKTYT